MPLPVTFASLSTATGAQLDSNFAALGALTPVPCSLAGSNSLTLTPLANTPTIPAYANYGTFVAVAALANTTGVTAAVGSLGALTVYKDTPSGPIALSGGEIAPGNVLCFVYDSTLGSGSGGFHLIALPASVLPTGGPSAGQFAQWQSASTLAGVAASGSGNVVLSSGASLTPANVAAAVFQTTTAYTVSTLPTASPALTGSRAYVTDASVASAANGVTAVGGGSNTMPVFCTGSAWVYG